MIQIQGNMGVNLPESDFDLNSSFAPFNISDFLEDLYMINDVSEKIRKVNNYVHELEDELRKIDAFKRELPFSVLLLNDAIERLKEEKMNCTDAKARPLMEEFMPLKGGNSNEDRGAKKSSDCSEKKNWMNSVQLWSTNVECENLDVKKQGSVSDLKSRMKQEDGYGSATESPYDQICSKSKNSGGAFVPFKRHSDLIIEKQKNKFLTINDLSLLSVPRVDMGSMNMNLKGDITKTTSGSSLSTDPKRKPRRCWSLELHTRFVNALQQLGGPQVATPKQIREIMQVGDLTNDEVKSHLQIFLATYNTDGTEVVIFLPTKILCTSYRNTDFMFKKFQLLQLPRQIAQGWLEEIFQIGRAFPILALQKVPFTWIRLQKGRRLATEIRSRKVITGNVDFRSRWFEDQAAQTDSRILQIHDI